MRQSDLDEYEPSESYKDDGWLKREYYDNGHTVAELAEMADTSTTTITRWMDKFGLERRDPTESQRLDHGTPDKVHHDPEWLREKYHGEKLTAREMGEEAGVSRSTIERSMERHGIDRRGKSLATSMATETVTYHTDSNGYVCARSKFNGKLDIVYMHRLLAISEFGFDSVTDSVVHHGNHIPWDNRPENLSIHSSHSEHIKKEHAPSRTRDEAGRFE